MEQLTQINWLAIVVVTIASFALGYLWYGPLFGKAWVAALGKEPEDIQPSPTPFIISVVAAAITCIVMALFIESMQIDTWLGGLCIGLLVGIGFIAASMASDNAFCGYSWTLFYIQAGYRVVYSVLMGIILAIW